MRQPAARQVATPSPTVNLSAVSAEPEGGGKLAACTLLYDVSTRFQVPAVNYGQLFVNPPRALGQPVYDNIRYICFFANVVSFDLFRNNCLRRKARCGGLHGGAWRHDVLSSGDAGRPLDK